jgi:hypothetical protein
MKIKVYFETDTDNEFYSDDKQTIIDMININSYKAVISEIQNRFRTIIKYELDNTSKTDREIIEDFYYNYLPELLENINIE